MPSVGLEPIKPYFEELSSERIEISAFDIDK
jgi:hypothetical protein